LLLVSALPVTVGAAPGPIHVTILFDLGDGSYFWSNASIADPTALNASWNATLEASHALGLPIKSTWFSCCGVAVTDVGERSPPSWPALLLWNLTARTWGDAPAGISSLALEDGDAIAWYVAGFDPNTYELRRPVPTPENRYPVVTFRGDAHNTGASPSQAPSSRLLKWDHDVGVREIGSTPAAAYGRLFLTTFKGLIALNASTGAEVWRNPHVKGFSTPAVFDGTLVAASSNGSVYRLNATDGHELWNATLMASTGFSGITSSPRVLYDRVYLGTFNESGGAGEVVALGLSDGTVAWRHSTGSVHYSTPAIQNGTLFVGVMGTYNTTTQITFDAPYGLLALDAQNGSQRWFYPTDGPVSASPTVVGSMVVAPAKDGSVHAVGTDGTPLWKKAVGADVASLAFGQGLLYAGGGAFGQAGSLAALDLHGEVRWTFAPNGPVQASPAYADGRVYFSTNTANGTIYALNASTGARVWSFVPEPNEYIRGSPVVADGVLYAPCDNGHLYAFGGGVAGIATLNVTSPGTFIPGREGAVELVIRSVQGRATGVRVALELPEGLSYASATPTPTLQSGRSVEWQVGDIGFEGAVTLELRVHMDASLAPGTNRSFFASLFFADDEGAVAPARAAQVEVMAGKAPSPGLLPAPGAAAAVTAIAAVVVVWRRGKPPAAP
jgi:outer membrane protein assembly factor BamB